MFHNLTIVVYSYFYLKVYYIFQPDRNLKINFLIISFFCIGKYIAYIVCHLFTIYSNTRRKLLYMSTFLKTKSSY